MSCCSDFCLGPDGLLAFWSFLLLLFENISKADLSHAYQIFEIKSVYFYNNSTNVFSSCMNNRGFTNAFQF